MTEMPLYEQVLTIAVCVLATMATRMVPFFLFRPGKTVRLYPIPWEGAALGGICPSCGVFAEGHSFLFGKSWCTGGAVSCGDGRGSCVEEKYVSFHGGRYGMLHGADKGFIESGKYGKPGKYFLGFLNLFLWNLFICTPAMICFIIMGRQP